MGYQYSQPLSSASSMPASMTSPTTAAAEAMFWNPIPGLPGPILPRNNFNQISPMGLESVLHTTDIGDRLGRDGFKINADWRSSHVNGFNTGVGGSVFGTANHQMDNGYTHRSNYVTPPDNSGYQQGPRDGMQQEDYDQDWWQNGNGTPGPMS